jgi:hypothetical protein
MLKMKMMMTAGVYVPGCEVEIALCGGEGEPSKRDVYTVKRTANHRRGGEKRQRNETIPPTKHKIK